MKVGILPIEGEAILNKWFIGVEVKKYSPVMFYDGFAFKPYFIFVFTKIIDMGTEYTELNGRPQKKIGGWLRVEFPIGIFIKISLI